MKYIVELHMIIWHLDIFDEVSVLISLPFLNQVASYCSVLRVFLCTWITSSLPYMCFANILSQSGMCLFIFLVESYKK